MIPTDYAPTRGEPPARVVPVHAGEIKIRLAEFMIKKGFVHTRGQWAGKPRMTILMKLTGLNYTTLHGLVNYPDDVRSISLPVLSKICAALNCQPGDFLVFERAQPGNLTPMFPNDYPTDTTVEDAGGESAITQW